MASEKNTDIKKVKFRTKICKVVSYDKKDLSLVVNFEGTNIKFAPVVDFDGKTATIQYRGRFGTHDFECRVDR